MGGFLDRIKNWWLVSTQSQKMATIGGSILTLLLLGGIFSFASKPKFALLYGGLNESDKGTIVAEIQAQGTPVKYDIPGQIEVPESSVAELRMRLASGGKVPKGAHLGNENLGDMNLYVTPAQERQRLKAIAEGELARSIETNPGVRSARVHITLGDPSPFMEQQRPPTASVSLITTGSGAITRESARGIAMLVANSVDGLDMKHVVVLDEKSVPLFDGGEVNGSDSAATNKIDMEQTLARKEEQRLQRNLDDIFGLGATKVSVRCEVNLDERRVKENKRTVTKGAATKTMKESMTGDAAAPAGAGSAANGLSAAPAAVQGGQGDNYVSKVEQMEPNITETQTETSKSAGSVQSMVINVAANVSRFTPEEGEKKDAFVASVRDFIANEMANKDGQEGFVTKVTEVAFDDSKLKKIETSVSEAKSEANMQRLMAMLPIGALLMVGLLVVKQFGKMQKQTATIVTPSGQLLQVPLVNGQIPAHYAMANSPSSSTDMIPADPEATLAQSINRYSEDQIHDGVAYFGDEEVLEVERIKEKKSAHLAAIKQMAKDRPEPTAMLIKTWISDDIR